MAQIWIARAVDPDSGVEIDCVQCSDKAQARAAGFGLGGVVFIIRPDGTSYQLTPQPRPARTLQDLDNEEGDWYDGQFD